MDIVYKQPISIGRARKILGQGASNMSDDQVRELLLTLHLLAKRFLKYNGSKKVYGNE